MRLFSHVDPTQDEKIIGLAVTHRDFLARYKAPLINLIMERLANMMAAYLYKNLKTEILEGVDVVGLTRDAMKKNLEDKLEEVFRSRR